MEASTYATFPKTEYMNRLEKVRGLMSKYNFDALLLTDQPNVTYFTGYPSIYSGDGCVILPLEEEPTLIPSVLELGNVEKTCWLKDIRYYQRESDPWAGPDLPKSSIPVIKKRLRELGVPKPRIGMEPGFEAMKQKLREFRIIDASFIYRLRMIKSIAEIEVIRKVCKATCDAIQASFESLRPGMKEREFVKVVYLNLIEKSDGYPPEFVIVRSGPEKCKMINALVNHKIIKKRELVILDAGATYREYPADTLRMACLGKPTEKQKKFFELAREAQQVCIDIIKPGIKARDIHNEGKHLFEKAGLKKGAYLGYSGHGLGIGGYNLPILNAVDETLIDEGMVLNIEPQCWDAPYVEAPAINAVVEDTVAVTKKGFEFLTNPETRDLFVVE